MSDFNFLIHDKRYSVPTLQFVTAEDVAGARALAEERLAESDEHSAVEVWESGALVFSIARDAAEPSEAG